MKQTTFASLAFERKKKQTRRERFLAEMEKVVPWAALLAVIEQHNDIAALGFDPFVQVGRAQSVPEPGTMHLFAVALLAVATLRRARSREGWIADSWHKRHT